VFLGFFFAFLGLVVYFCCAATAAPARTEDLTTRFGGVYRRPLANEPVSLDPAHTTNVYANTVVNQLFDGLVQFDSHLNPIPAIAGFWEASLDGLTWTFSLRKEVKFHNGREVTADDFVYSFTRLLDPVVKSPVADLFKYIRGAEAFQEGKTPKVEGLQALDRYTLQISLYKSYAPFLSILAMVNAKVVPREEVEGRGEQFAIQPVGSGPFRFQRWEPKRQIVIQAYDNYYEGRPFLDQIVFEMRVDKGLEEGFSRFLRGELEESVVPSTKAEEIQNNPLYRSYTYLTKPTLHLLYIGFNLRQEPFTNRKVRQAFNYAVNKDAIVQEIRKRTSITAKGLLPPGMPGYDPDLVSYYYNPRRAEQLLAEAGYPGGQGLPALDLWYSSNETSAPQELEAYREALAALGVTINIRKADNWPILEKLLEEGKPAMFRLGWHSDIPDPDNFLFPLLFSQSKTNRTFYRNAQVDQFLDEARREIDYAQRIKIYRDVEKLVLQDAPWISQHHHVFESLYQPYVQGIEINALGAHYIPMKKVWLKKTADRKAETKP
jgi:peptide/nickel transport system substrate-binding protein/oligopeptide transport system substrate-binding protein